jgi:hypothetical protein
MARLVLDRVRTHPLLQPLRDAGQAVWTSCHEWAIFAQAIPIGRGEYELEARITYPDWGEPVKDTREDWAGKSATRLAKNIRIQWDARDPDAKPEPLRGLGDR